MRCVVFSAAVFIAAQIPQPATSIPASPPINATTFAVRDVRLFDGRSIVRQSTVVVQNGVITAAGPQARVPDGIRTIDGRGRTLLPGLIDAHVHYLAPRNLQQALAFGITTELDMGSDPVKVAEAKEALTEDSVLQADLYSSGSLVTAPGGHGTEYGLKISTLSKESDATAFVDARINEGSDYIKIVYDDGRTYKPLPTLSREELKAVVDAAHHRNKLAIVHVGSAEEAMTSIRLGADGLAHLFVDAPAPTGFAAAAKRDSAFVIPTMVVMEKIVRNFDRTSLLKDPLIRPFLSPTDIASLKRSFPVRSAVTTRISYATNAVRMLKNAGATILAGSDSAMTHGPLLLRELELLVEAGLTPTEALASATSRPANAFDLSDRGEIRVGARADLLLVRGDPSEDIKDLRNIERVWQAGREFDRTAFAQKLGKHWAADEALRRAPPPVGSESGVVSDFDNGKPHAAFGAGWAVVTDKIAGGASIATMESVAGGANGSPYALRVTGEILPGFPFGFAGVAFNPGEKPYAPANLQGKKISFWARGDGKSYGLMVSASSYGSQPVTVPFVAPADWAHYSIPFDEFDDMEGHDVTSIMFAGGPRLGAFRFELDEVRID